MSNRAKYFPISHYLSAASIYAARGVSESVIGLQVGVAARHHPWQKSNMGRGVDSEGRIAQRSFVTSFGGVWYEDNHRRGIPLALLSSQ